MTDRTTRPHVVSTRLSHSELDELNAERGDVRMSDFLRVNILAALRMPWPCEEHEWRKP